MACNRQYRDPPPIDVFNTNVEVDDLAIVAGEIYAQHDTAVYGLGLPLQGFDDGTFSLPRHTTIDTITQDGGAATAPDAFSLLMWDLDTGSADKELDITINSLPANNGAAITDSSTGSAAAR